MLVVSARRANARGSSAGRPRWPSISPRGAFPFSRGRLKVPLFLIPRTPSGTLPVTGDRCSEIGNKGQGTLCLSGSLTAAAACTGLQTLGRSTRPHSSKPAALREGQGPAGRRASRVTSENGFLCEWPQTVLKQRMRGPCLTHGAASAHVCDPRGRPSTGDLRFGTAPFQQLCDLLPVPRVLSLS